MNISVLSTEEYEARIVKAKQTVYQPTCRTTFGIVDPSTGKQYEDVKHCHLEARRLQLEEWLLDGSIKEAMGRQKPYKLLLDHKACKELLKKGCIDAMISFQTRTDIDVAIVRLFDQKRILPKDSL